MKELVFFLEEESAKALLQVLLPRLLPAECGVQTRFVVFEGKGDLTRQLERKLRGYQNPKAGFIVLRDQDHDDCAKIKQDLVCLSNRAGKPHTAVTIACREIEAFYLGDLHAVEVGLDLPNLTRLQQKARFRSPDSVEMPARALETLTRYRYLQGQRLPCHSPSPQHRHTALGELSLPHQRHPLRSALAPYPTTPYPPEM